MYFLFGKLDKKCYQQLGRKFVCVFLALLYSFNFPQVKLVVFIKKIAEIEQVK